MRLICAAASRLFCWTHNRQTSAADQGSPLLRKRAKYISTSSRTKRRFENPHRDKKLWSLFVNTFPAALRCLWRVCVCAIKEKYCSISLYKGSRAMIPEIQPGKCLMAFITTIIEVKCGGGRVRAFSNLREPLRERLHREVNGGVRFHAITDWLEDCVFMFSNENNISMWMALHRLSVVFPTSAFRLRSNQWKLNRSPWPTNHQMPVRDGCLYINI